MSEDLRMLRAPLSTRYKENPDGSLIIFGIKLLAEGQWTDSAVQTPLFYTAEVLRQYANNWIDSSLWVRHSGGTPRDATDKIGDIINHRFEDNAIMGDLLYHRQTQTSKDAANLAIHYLHTDTPQYVSVEHGGKEIYNPETRRNEASELVFVGAAQVIQGACRKCRINSSNDHINSQEELPLENEELIEKVKELEGIVEALNTDIETKDARIKELEAPVEEETVENPEIKELGASIESLTESLSAKDEQIKELSEKLETMSDFDARIKKLEEAPAPVTVAGTPSGSPGYISSVQIKPNGEITGRKY